MPNWEPKKKYTLEIDALVSHYRQRVPNYLEPLVSDHYPEMLGKADNEYRKMIELSTKMTVVGYACTELLGYRFDERRQVISTLYGGCCFISDSFLDDFGEAATQDYLKRFEVLLTRGWFEIRNEREELFYVMISRLFTERDVMDPMLRQAIFWLFLAQKRDVLLRLKDEAYPTVSRIRLLRWLKESARNRSGHALIVLTRFLVPEIPLRLQSLIFTAGALIMHIDDHGDCFSDRRFNRVTYMNQLKHPARTLQKIFMGSITRLREGLPDNPGRELLIAFLARYYITRVKKHRLEKESESSGWAVYE